VDSVHWQQLSKTGQFVDAHRYVKRISWGKLPIVNHPTQGGKIMPKFTKFGNKCWSAIPLTHGQTTNEKHVTILCPLVNFGAQGGSPWLKFTNLGNNVHQSQAYQSAKFPPVLTTSLRAICCQMLISLTTWRREWATNKRKKQIYKNVQQWRTDACRRMVPRNPRTKFTKFGE